MKHFLITALLVFVVQGIWAQDFPSEKFHNGMLILNTGDTLKGEIQYNLEQNIIQLKLRSKIEAASAKEVLFFEIMDQDQNRYRQFYSIPYTKRGNYTSPHFFEVLFQGELSLLSREYIRTENLTSGFNYYSNASRDVLDYRLFFFTSEQKVVYYDRTKKELFKLLNNKASELKSFMKKNNLKADRIEDVVQIVIEYNKLLQK